MESPAQNLKILIIANSRFKGGLSGSDAIYESFKKYWQGCHFTVWDMQEIDYRPFIFCYLHRLFLSLFLAIVEREKYSMVYSSSDFLPDSLAGLVFKLKGKKWIAGFFLKAFKENPIHFYSQAVVRQLIKWFADMVIVTNPTMYPIFPDKKKTWINGGIDLKLAGFSNKRKIYDAVFCGRIHPSKGINELIEIWSLVRKQRPDARLALIGDGDLGLDYVRNLIKSAFGLNDNGGIDLLGYMGDERYEIYKQSKVVLYPTPLKYDHFSIAPVEAMACGCPMLCFSSPVLSFIGFGGLFFCYDKEEFVYKLIRLIGDYSIIYDGDKFIGHNDIVNHAIEWAQKFDYEKQSLRVFNDIKAIL